MKEYAHLIAATVLAVFSFSILIVNMNEKHIRPLEIARMYTKKRIRGDISAALHEVKSDATFLTPQCMRLTNLSTDLACLNDREKKRDSILHYMKCTEYGSQTCSYLRLVLQPLAKTSLTERVAGPTSPFKVFGLDLEKTKTPGGESYRQILARAIEYAPTLFHNAALAEESDKTVVLRSSLYNMIMMAIFANLLVHVIDSMLIRMQYIRSGVRALSFILVFITSLVFFGMHTGTALVFWFIVGMASVNMVYFEMFLDPTIVRPWIHPFAFSVIYMSLTVLALVENGVQEYMLVVIHIMLAAAASQIFMSAAWFYAGEKEKMRMTSSEPKRLHEVYKTKETQFALWLGLVIQLVIPLQLIFSPYNFTFKSLFMLASPAIFSVLAMFSLTVVENMTLDDEYGNSLKLMAWLHDTPLATYISGAKLYASLMLLSFGTVLTLILLQNHIATTRAFMDEMPEASITLDNALSRRYLIGQGLNSLS